MDVDHDKKEKLKNLVKKGKNKMLWNKLSGTEPSHNIKNKFASLLGNIRSN